MNRMALQILFAKKRRSILACFVVAFCVLFILLVNTIYISYRNIQIENGYAYGGSWDIAVQVEAGGQQGAAKLLSDITLAGTINNTYSARLDKIPEDKKEGYNSIYADCYYLSLLGIGSVEDNVLPYELVEGKWPENDNEIVLPHKFEYDGASVNQGSIQVGDKITLEVGCRIKSDGTISQEQIEDYEEFTDNGLKEYTVCGIMKYDNYTTGNYVSYGFVGMDNEAIGGSDNEVMTMYYKLNNLNPQNLKNTYKEIIDNGNVIDVKKNTYIENALYVVYESDLMKSVKYGLYIFEAFIILLGFSIICVNQYQNIKEDEKQLILLHTIGAEKRHICYIYCVQNFIVGLTGLALALLLFIGFRKLIQVIFPVVMRSQLFRSDMLAVKPAFIMVVLILTLLGMLCLTMILIRKEFTRICIPKKGLKRVRNRRTSSKNRAPMKSIFELAANNIKFAKARNRILMLIITIILVVLSVGIPICRSAYQYSVEASKAASFADFFIIMNEVSDKLDQELNQMESISNIDRVYTSFKRCYIPAEALGEKVIASINEQYPQTEGNSYIPFNENNEYVYSASVASVNEKFYEKLKQMNDYLPTYKEFAEGDNCLIFGELLLPEQDERIDVGASIGAYMDTIDLWSYDEIPVKTELQIKAVLERILLDETENYVNVIVYVPENLYKEKYYNNSYTMYFADGYSGRMDELGEQLKQISRKYSVIVQDNISESSAAKDSLTIQFISITAGIIMLVMMGMVSIYVIMKVDYISRIRTYITYRALGLSRCQAVLLQFTEQMISLINALLLSAATVVILSFSILHGIMVYYNFYLNDVAFFMLLTILIVIILILWNAVRMSGERYRYKIGSVIEKTATKTYRR